VPWRRAFPTWTLGFDDGQAVPGRDAYQQRDALAKALVEALGGDEDLAQALADDDKFVEAVRATFESPKSLGSQPAVLDARACDEQAFVAGAARRRAQTAAAVDWEAMHPSASANTLTLAAGQTATFTWEDNHDVWEFKDEASYNACNFAGAVEKASTSVKTVDISPGTTTAQTRYYGCSVGSHCDDGQKIAISWTDADGCLSHENYECDSNCDGSCDECNEGCDDGCNEDCDEDSSGNYCSSWEYGCNYDCDQNCNTGCDEECNDKCDGSCDDSCSCKDADAAAARAVSSGAALLALAALLL
jgi:plastocyanin